MTVSTHKMFSHSNSSQAYTIEGLSYKIPSLCWALTQSLSLVG